MNELPLDALWVYLAGSPLLALTATLAAYIVAVAAFERSGQRPWLNPVLVSVLALVGFITAADIPYAEYFEGAQFVHFLLGPATISLAVPLYRELPTLRRRAGPVALALVAGLVTTVGTTMLLARVTGLDEVMRLSIAAKSVTAPVAMGITERIGGIPSLTAVFAILTGVFGAVVAVPVLARLRITDDAAKGLAIGLVAHGIGTARAFRIGERAGAYAGLGMALSATLTAFGLPYVVGWLAR